MCILKTTGPVAKYLYQIVCFDTSFCIFLILLGPFDLYEAQALGPGTHLKPPLPSTVTTQVILIELNKIISIYFLNSS